MKRSGVVLMWLAALVLMAGVVGCGVKSIRVESDTEWRGSWDNATVEGAGNKVFRTRADIQCYFFQKETERGYLRIEVLKGNGPEPSTIAEYGAVSGCVE